MDEETRVRVGSYEDVIFATWWERLRHRYNPWAARWFYSGIFFIMCVMTVVLRIYGLPLMILIHDLPYMGKYGALTDPSANSTPYKLHISNCRGGEDCLKAEAVLRMSWACFLSYLCMAVLTVRISYLSQRREGIHSKKWRLKLICLVLIIVICFFIPSTGVHYYGAIAVYISWVYLLIQSISLITIIPKATNVCQRWRIDRYVATLLCIVSLGMMIYMCMEYESCTQNIFIIIGVGFQVILLTVVSLLPMVNVGFLTPSFMGSYIVYLSYYAISSEPLGRVCANRVSPTWERILTFLVVVGVLTYNTQSTGLDYAGFRFETRVRVIGEVPYRYWVFHLLFAIGGPYMAMIAVGWDTAHTMTSWSLNSTWTSTVVILVTQTVSTFIYIWFIICRELLRGRSLRSYIAEIQLRRMLK